MNAGEEATNQPEITDQATGGRIVSEAPINVTRTLEPSDSTQSTDADSDNILSLVPPADLPAEPDPLTVAICEIFTKYHSTMFATVHHVRLCFTSDKLDSEFNFISSMILLSSPTCSTTAVS